MRLLALLSNGIFINAVVLLAFASSIYAEIELISPEKLVADVNVNGLKDNLQRLNDIAQANGGNRAFGFVGLVHSRDYVLERVNRFRPAIRSWMQNYPLWFTEIYNITLSVSNDIGNIDIAPFDNTTTTPKLEPIAAPLVLVPVNDVSGTGCLDSDYNGLNVTGKIALIKRGSCTFGLKAKLAGQKGAVGALIWNNVAMPVMEPTMGLRDDYYAPAGLINFVDGQKLMDRLSMGEELEATLWINARREWRFTWNVIAETRGGNPRNVIILGAHLDSAQTSPGINDGGSGSSALLELLAAVQKYRVKNKVRFIWWGTEVRGSFHYTVNLRPRQVSNIALYLNFNRIGSKNPLYGVLDGDGSTYGFKPPAGSEHIEKLFTSVLSSPPYNLEVTPTGLSNSSDCVGFVNLGIPVGGLFTGTSLQDNCYHLPCDDINNVDLTTLEINTRTAARVLATYALDLSGLPNEEERMQTVQYYAARGGSGSAENNASYLIASDGHTFL